VRTGWGVLHWVAYLPLYVGFIGFLVFGLVALGPYGDAYPPGLLFVFFIGTFAIWAVSFRLVRWMNVRAAKRAPVGGVNWRWTISGEGLAFDSPIQSSLTRWQAIKDVQEERDRFVFLLTPAHNPVLPTRFLTTEQKRALRALVADVRGRGVLGAGVD
jgi:hypothetical protein